MRSASKYFIHDHVTLAGWLNYEPDDYLLFIIDLLNPKEEELVLDDGSEKAGFP